MRADNHVPSHRRDGAGNGKPYLLVGSGPLTATIWKSGADQALDNYRFNIIRTSRRSGRVSQKFAPQDLGAFVKLIRVLAFALADDGCLPADLQEDLARLASTLEDIQFGARQIEEN